MRKRGKTTITALLLAFAAAAGIVHACGGYDEDFDGEEALSNGDGGLTCRLRFSYQAELRLAFGEMPKPADSQLSPPVQTEEVFAKILELLDEALAKQGISNAEQRAGAVARMRQLLKNKGDWNANPGSEAEASFRLIPEEFILYALSLADDSDKALKATEKLIGLPGEKRANLSALAHYKRARLLTIALQSGNFPGNSQIKSALAEIRRSHEAVLDEIKRGSPNIARVDVAALGWLAHSKCLILPGNQLRDLQEEDLAEAMSIYLGLRARGEQMGENSAYLLIRALSKDWGAYELCARDEKLRSMMTLYLCSGGNGLIRDIDEDAAGTKAGNWILALRNAKVDFSKDAVRLATLLYNCGDYDECEGLLNHVGLDNPVAALLRSRLAIRTGRIAAAAESLGRCVKQLPDKAERPNWDTTWWGYKEEEVGFVNLNRSQNRSVGGKVRAELATLALAKGDYGLALKESLMAGIKGDAHYIAECVLTIDELRAMVDGEFAGWKGAGYGDELKTSRAASMRQLLAQRLWQAGRQREALGYMQDEQRRKAEKLMDLLALGEDAAGSPRTRAAAFWRAALLSEELFAGCEFFVIRLDKALTSKASWPISRTQPNHEYPWQPISGPGADEVKRVEAWLNRPTGTWAQSGSNGGYEMLRLALLAASLVPDDDPAGAHILQYAGRRMMYADPKAANAAYKALASRFRNTEFGKYAHERRWFRRSDEMPAADWDLLGR